MAWDETVGQVTRAFDEWRLVDGDIRAYLRLCMRLASAAYEVAFYKAEEESNGDYFSLPDVAAWTEGLWPFDFEWMLRASTVKDAVTALEVYLEKVQEEVLHAWGRPVGPRERAPRWGELTSFVEGELDVDIRDMDDLDNVRAIRHLLTHRRGELRTKAQRQRFASEPLDYQVQLTEEATVEYLDTLASHVRRIDRVAYQAAWG